MNRNLTWGGLNSKTFCFIQSSKYNLWHKLYVFHLVNIHIRFLLHFKISLYIYYLIKVIIIPRSVTRMYLGYILIWIITQFVIDWTGIPFILKGNIKFLTNLYLAKWSVLCIYLKLTIVQWSILQGPMYKIVQILHFFQYIIYPSLFCWHNNRQDFQYLFQIPNGKKIV